VARLRGVPGDGDGTVSVSIGPIRFNGDADAEAFRDWARDIRGEDVRDLEDWMVEHYFSAYEGRCDCSDCRKETGHATR
jgi:hypothetical protein